jgi:integrase
LRGNISYQVHEVFKNIIAFGSSKHEAKNEAREAGARTWHRIGKNLLVYSYNTADSYRDIAKETFSFAKSEFGIKDITKLEAQHINAFLESKIESNVKYSTFQKYAAACEKLEVALTKYTGKEYNFDLSETRELAQQILQKTEQHRAYENPQKVINAIKDSTYRTIAAAQLESGARVSELNHLKLSQFKENQAIEVQGKGGKIRDLELSKETYDSLKSLVENSQDKKLVFNTDSYRNELKAACERTGAQYQGTHGLRWSYSQNLFKQLQQQGKTYEESLSIVSQKLGHERPDITEHYLK